jgi:hypothetical protein
MVEWDQTLTAMEPGRSIAVAIGERVKDVRMALA